MTCGFKLQDIVLATHLETATTFGSLQNFFVSHDFSA